MHQTAVDALDHGEQVEQYWLDRGESDETALTRGERAEDWYSNTKYRNYLLDNITRKVSEDVFEISVGKGDLDEITHDWYEVCSEGAELKPSDYSGREGLFKLPGKLGEYGNDTIGFRSASEAKGGAPAIDFKIDGQSFRIHFVH